MSACQSRHCRARTTPLLKCRAPWNLQPRSVSLRTWVHMVRHPSHSTKAPVRPKHATIASISLIFFEVLQLQSARLSNYRLDHLMLCQGTWHRSKSKQIPPDLAIGAHIAKQDPCLLICLDDAFHNWLRNASQQVICPAWVQHRHAQRLECLKCARHRWTSTWSRPGKKPLWPATGSWQESNCNQHVQIILTRCLGHGKDATQCRRRRHIAQHGRKVSSSQEGAPVASWGTAK